MGRETAVGKQEMRAKNEASLLICLLRLRCSVTAPTPARVRLWRSRAVGVLSPPSPAQVDVFDLGRDVGAGLSDRFVVAAFSFVVNA